VSHSTARPVVDVAPATKRLGHGRRPVRHGGRPCLDASFEGRPFHAPSLAYESRWPAFTPGPRTRDQFHPLHSAHGRGYAVGALNVYSRTPPSSPRRRSNWLPSLPWRRQSSSATPGPPCRTRPGRRLPRRCKFGRHLQAQGAIMARDGLSSDDAYTTLWRLSRRSGDRCESWPRCHRSTQRHHCRKRLLMW